MAYTDYLETVQKIYIGYYGRPADPAGLLYWSAKLDAQGGNLNEIIEAFANSSEAETLYGPINSDTIGNVVDQIYTALFNRAAEAGGKAYYVDGFNAGRFTAATIMLNILDGAQHEDLSSVKNKLTSADLFTKTINPGLDGKNIQVTYSGDADAEQGRNFLKTVTWNPATLPTQAETTDFIRTNIADPSDPIFVGQTFTLTTGPDIIEGTSGNDVINGMVDFGGAKAPGALSTYNTSDQINGGAGTDTMNLVLQNAAGGAITDFSAPNISNVEVVNIHNVSGQDLYATGAGALDVATLLPGVVKFVADRSTKDIFLKNIAAGAEVGIKGNGVTTNANFEATYAAAATDGVLNVSDGTTAGAAKVLGAGLTKVTVNSTGADNVLTSLDVAGTTKTVNINAAKSIDFGTGITGVAAGSAINVSGVAAKVKLSTVANSVKTVDASGLTAGGIEASLGTGVEDVKGGAGNDVVVLNTAIKTANFGAGDDKVTTANFAAAAAASAIDGGDGNDTLVIAAAADINSAAKRAAYANFEVLQSKVAAANIDMDGFSNAFVSVVAEANAGFTNMTATQAGDVKLLADTAGRTYSLKTATGTSDVLAVTLANTTATASADLATATINGFETLNVTSSSGVKVAAGDLNVVSFTAADSLAAINVGGEYSVALNLANTAKAVTVNSTQTGTAVLNVLGAAIKGSVINTSANGDTIVTAAVAGTTGDFVTYNAGAGNDTVSTTAAILNNSSDANGSLKIDGGEGIDTLNFTDATGLTIGDAQFEYVTGMEKISYTVAGQAATITTGGFFNTNFANGVEVTLGEDVTGKKALTLDANSYAAAATVKAFTIGAGGSIVVKTGSGNDTVTLTAGAATDGPLNVETGLGNDTVDFTAVVAGGATTIKTGAGDDVIKDVKIVATITGGAGADQITLGGGTAQTIVQGATDSGITLTTADKITGFITAEDTIKTGTAGTAGNYNEAGSAVANFDAALDAANTVMNKTIIYSFQFDAENGYLFWDTNADGTADQVIVLVGLNDTGIVAADIIA